MSATSFQNFLHTSPSCSTTLTWILPTPSILPPSPKIICSVGTLWRRIYTGSTQAPLCYPNASPNLNGGSIFLHIVIARQVKRLAHRMNIEVRKKRPNVHLIARRFCHRISFRRLTCPPLLHEA